MNKNRLLQIIVIPYFFFVGIGICMAEDYSAFQQHSALGQFMDRRAAFEDAQSQQQFELQKMQYQHQLEMERMQAESALKQGSQSLEKIFSVVGYQDAETAQNAYNDFVAGRQNFNGVMFTLNKAQNSPYFSLYNSLQVRQLTTVMQGSDGRYFIVIRLQ